MADRTPTSIPAVSSDQRRVAAENYERAREVLQSGNSDYAIQLLRTCCRLDPASLPFPEGKVRQRPEGQQVRVLAHAEEQGHREDGEGLS
jgi:hypothetical protein